MRGCKRGDKITQLLIPGAGAADEDVSLQRARWALYGSHALSSESLPSTCVECNCSRLAYTCTAGWRHICNHWYDRLTKCIKSSSMMMRADATSCSSTSCAAAWGVRQWEFAVGLLMLQLWPQSLALVSAYGLADSGAQVLAGASVGSYLSR